MATFNAPSEGGNSLSAKIALMNARRKTTTVQEVEVPNFAEPVEVEKNLVPSDEVLEAQKEESGPTTDELLATLVMSVQDLKNEIKKINKHVNSIVKKMGDK